MAEAARARDDLKECIQYVMKQKMKEGEDDSRRSSMITEPTSNVSPKRISEPNAFSTPEKPSDGAVSIRPSQSETNKQDNPRQATPSTQVSGGTTQSAHFPDDHSISSFSSDGYPRRNLALCFWAQRGKETVDKGPAFERMDNDIEPKRVSLFRRRQKKSKDKSPSNQKEARLKSSHRAKAIKLNEALAETDREADELRTRLHSITRYYDNIVVSLQQNAGSNNSGNTEYEADMINQLSFLDREKRAVMTELRQKDALIAKHKREITQLVENAPLKAGRNGIPVHERAWV